MRKHPIALILAACLACLSIYPSAVEAQTPCAHFEKQLSRLQRQHPRVDISNLGSQELCFDSCTGDQIRAARYWEQAAPASADAIQTELAQYADTTGYSTEIAIPGRSQAIDRISRRVGTASCIRDTYLTRAADGYRLMSNSILDDLSQEAGYCGRSFVYFETWRSRSYAVLWDEGEGNTEIIAYRVTPSLDVENQSTVSMPNTRDSSFMS
ncbi:hypothetical protein AAGS40_30335 (plasmid) [Paraburkholderia sp. PREW-6R]|uniref:hypothetical protein n=1 Tax=Paraburkholderia sp. PREW-6R TaxID=3141544 RepID=UPI0031F51DE5